MELSPAQSERYGRHLVLAGVGIEGQRKLSEARVLIVGAGGLGCPIGFYLAAAGVGNITLVDNDLVELGNLQRQIAHRTDKIGTPKVLSLRDAMLGLNPEIRVTPVQERLGPENAERLIKGHDVVVDASDNFPTRFLINDICVLMGIRLVTGAVSGYEGQAMTVLPPETACYRCVFEAPPPYGAVPSPDVVGLLSTIPGVIGTIQATEVLKLILGIGETLAGRLLIFDALAMRFRTVPVGRNPACAVCGETPPTKTI